MSVSSALAGSPGLPRPIRRFLVAVVALAAIAALIALLGVVLGSGRPAPPLSRNPFGTGIREAAPAASGLGAWILAIQSEFYRSLTGALSALKRDGGAIWSLALVGFLYGVFHAAGPGHGKGVISGYLLATRRTLLRGVALSFAAAFVQAAVAIALVGVMAAVLQSSSGAISATARTVEIASFAALLLVGLALLWRKTAGLVPASSRAAAVHQHHGHKHDHQHHGHAHGDGCGCGHSHGPSAAEVDGLKGLREGLGVVLAAGIRPCSGAIILLVFSLSQGLFWAGIAATLAMAIGTAITTGALAALAVMAKNVALRFANGRGERGARAVAWLEVLAAAFVAVLGGALLLGLWAGTGS